MRFVSQEKKEKSAKKEKKKKNEKQNLSDSEDEPLAMLKKSPSKKVNDT